MPGWGAAGTGREYPGQVGMVQAARLHYVQPKAAIGSNWSKGSTRFLPTLCREVAGSGVGEQYHYLK